MKKMRFLSRGWRRFLIAVGVFYATMCLLMVLGESTLLYQPYPGPETPEAAKLPAYQRLYFTSVDGLRIPYWEHKDSGPIVIYLHGNGGGLHAFHGPLDFLDDTGLHIVAMEYRGFAGAPGKPSQHAIATDARALFDAMKKRYPDKPIVIWGYSLGSGVATELAAQRPPAVLVLEAPFTAAVDLASEFYPIFPVRRLMRNQYRSRDVMENIKAPVFIMHGTNDGIVPFRHGEALFALAHEPKRFMRYEGANHMTLRDAGAYDDAVRYIHDTLK